VLWRALRRSAFLSRKLVGLQLNKYHHQNTQKRCHMYVLFTHTLSHQKNIGWTDPPKGTISLVDCSVFSSIRCFTVFRLHVILCLRLFPRVGPTRVP
jgi:hypothetical protein